jgi:hypothetical protein
MPNVEGSALGFKDRNHYKSRPLKNAVLQRAANEADKFLSSLDTSSVAAVTN